MQLEVTEFCCLSCGAVSYSNDAAMLANDLLVYSHLRFEVRLRNYTPTCGGD
jgi:hypothetical protein